MKTAKKSGRSGGKAKRRIACRDKELKHWAAYHDSNVRKAAVRVNLRLLLPAWHFDASTLRLERPKWPGDDPWWPPPRPARRLSSRSPSRDREEGAVFPIQKLI